MKNKIVLIADKESGYVNRQLNKVLEEWNRTRSSIKETTFWSPGSNNVKDLFGNTPTTLLNLSKSEDKETFQKWYKKEKKTLAPDWFGECLIILIEGSLKGGVKALENIVLENGGTVYKESKEKDKKEALLDNTFLSSEAKDFLISYAGQDYTMLIPVLNALDKISKEKQEKMTDIDLLSMLPKEPGQGAPWDFVDPTFKGETSKAIEEANNALKYYHPILLFTFLIKSIRAMEKSFYARNILNKYRYKDQEAALGVGKIDSFYTGFSGAYGIDENTLLKLSDEITKTESIYKGKSGALDVKQHFLVLVYKISETMKNK